MSRFHRDIMNAPCDSRLAPKSGTIDAYATGHRDARHQAAEIAARADAEVERLRARAEAAEARLAETEASREFEDMLLATRAYNMAWADIEAGRRKRDPRVILSHARAALEGSGD